MDKIINKNENKYYWRFQLVSKKKNCIKSNKKKHVIWK